MASTEGKLNVSELDFTQIKENLIGFLKNQEEFVGYDFRGSSFDVLLDVLAYNTHYNSYYANMVANEMFLDSAVLRSSVVARAKHLGYLPRSAKGSKAYVDLTITPTDDPAVITIPRFTQFQGDVDGVNYVFHTAAEARIQPAIENPVEAVSINSVGTCNVLQCAREAGVDKVVYSSTAAAYGLNEPPNDEEQPNDCLNPYSVSKVNGEELCQMYTNLFGLKTVILRYFNAYGNRSPIRGQYVPVIGIFLRQLAAGEALTIVGDGEQRRDFVNVLDIASANILAAIKNLPDENYGQIYNIGTGINYSVNEIANMISDNVVYVPPRIGEARITLANNQKMKNVFDWEPEIDVKDWIMGVLK